MKLHSTLANSMISLWRTTLDRRPFRCLIHCCPIEAILRVKYMYRYYLSVFLRLHVTSQRPFLQKDLLFDSSKQNKVNMSYHKS